MSIVSVILGEHAVLQHMFSEVDRALVETRALPEVLRHGRVLQSLLLGHAKLEDRHLMPALERDLGPQGPILHSEHQEIDDLFRSFKRSKTRDEAARRLLEVIDVAREHFAKEEQLVLKLLSDLSPALQSKIARLWIADRGLNAD